MHRSQSHNEITDDQVNSEFNHLNIQNEMTWWVDCNRKAILFWKRWIATPIDADIQMFKVSHVSTNVFD